MNDSDDKSPIITSGFAPVMFPHTSQRDGEWVWKSGGFRARATGVWHGLHRIRSKIGRRSHGRPAAQTPQTQPSRARRIVLTDDGLRVS